MDDIRIEEAHLSDLVPMDETVNPRQHTQRGLALIEQGLQEDGFGRSMVIGPGNVIVGGNGTSEAAANVGMEQVIIVDAPPDVLVATRRKDLDPETIMRMAVRDNRSSDLSDFHPGVLYQIRQAYPGITDGIFGSEDRDVVLGSILQEPQVYTPNTTPEIVPREVSLSDLAEARKRLEERVYPQKPMTAVVCPNCSKTFYED